MKMIGNERTIQDIIERERKSERETEIEIANVGRFARSHTHTNLSIMEKKDDAAIIIRIILFCFRVNFFVFCVEATIITYSLSVILVDLSDATRHGYDTTRHERRNYLLKTTARDDGLNGTECGGDLH